MGTGSEEAALTWHDAREVKLEGKGWEDTANPYERLPARARGVVPDAVWTCGLHPAGLCFVFETDAPSIRARWTLASMPHVGAQQAATGSSGLDLYAADSAGQWRWAHCFQPTSLENEAATQWLDPGRRRYKVYLPVRNPVGEVRIGVPADAAFAFVAPPADKPVVYYGTSIVHGIAATRPGMCHAAILGRRLGRPMMNLGFAGNGRMEIELADLLAELDPCVYLLDCLPNMNAGQLEERAEPFVRRLRAARPDTPIVLIEDRTYGNAWISPVLRERNATSRVVYRAVYERLVAAGVGGLTYVEGERLLGDDSEDTVDGSHPTDLGFWRMADALTPIVRDVVHGGSVAR